MAATLANLQASEPEALEFPPMPGPSNPWDTLRVRPPRAFFIHETASSPLPLRPMTCERLATIERQPRKRKPQPAQRFRAVALPLGAVTRCSALIPLHRSLACRSSRLESFVIGVLRHLGHRAGSSDADCALRCDRGRRARTRSRTSDVSRDDIPPKPAWQSAIHHSPSAPASKRAGRHGNAISLVVA